MSENKTIVITGCSRGLGKALVAEFIARGHTIAGCARNRKSIEQLGREYAGQASFRALDICDEVAVQSWAEDTLEELGPPDLLINNAAMINRPASLWQIERDEFQQLLDVNIVAVHTLLRHWLPAMIGKGQGVIVNLSSGWGRSVSADVAPYCASKWAIEGMTKALAEELPDGLAAIPLNPGVIDTPMLREVWGDAAEHYNSAEQWATRAAPFILNLNVEHNGQSLTAP